MFARYGDMCASINCEFFRFGMLKFVSMMSKDVHMILSEASGNALFISHKSAWKFNYNPVCFCTTGAPLLPRMSLMSHGYDDLTLGVSIC